MRTPVQTTGVAELFMDPAHGSARRFHIQDDHGDVHEVDPESTSRTATMRTTDGYDVLAIEGGNYWIEQLRCFAHRLD